MKLGTSEIQEEEDKNNYFTNAILGDFIKAPIEGISNCYKSNKENIGGWIYYGKINRRHSYVLKDITEDNMTGETLILPRKYNQESTSYYVFSKYENLVEINRDGDWVYDSLRKVFPDHG